MTSDFGPVRTEKAHEAVARKLRAAILDGRYTTGDRLPVERELVASFAVSRSAVRQALLSLEQQGLITVRAGSGGGAFVADTGVQPILRAFENLFALQPVTTAQYFQAKAVVEPAISAAATANIRPEHLEQLAANIAEGHEVLRAGGDMFANSAQFHLIIARATANPMLELLLEVMIRVGVEMSEFHTSDDHSWTAVLDDHGRIVEALRDGDSDDVHRLMTEHLGAVDAMFTPRDR